MSAKNSIITLLICILVLLGGIAVFNFSVDPQCYYSCSEVDTNKRTLNTYYQAAQRLLAYPSTQVIILGSSRGETTPPLWVEKTTGLPTLNLSVSGAELATKIAFLKIAQEKTQLRKVIWLADYFELIQRNADAKIKNTPALKKYLKTAGTSSAEVQDSLALIQSLVDHNTLEASLHFLKARKGISLTKGPGSDISDEHCKSAEFKGKETPESLKKEVDLIYESYVSGVINASQDESAWLEFQKTVRSVAEQGIEVQVVVAPYHPQFLMRLKQEYPEIYTRHLVWLQRIHSLRADKVTVSDYFLGFPWADESPVFWNDGVHFTCKSAILMLEASLVGR